MKSRLARYPQQLLARARRLHWEDWVALLLALGTPVIGVAILAGWVHLYAGDVVCGSNRYYLLSSIAQALAAILALAVTATLVATQLAAQSFTPRAINHRLHDPWLWGAVAIYIAAIAAALAGMAQASAGRTHASWDSWSIDLTLLLTGLALAYLGPFTAAVLRSLDTDTYIRSMLEENDYPALEDFMRRAMNEGLVRQVDIVMKGLEEHAMKKLQISAGGAKQAEQARDFAGLGLRLGKYAAAEKDPEAIIVTVDYLTAMTTYCTGRLYRGAADVFNESVIELVRAAEEAFG